MHSLGDYVDNREFKQQTGRWLLDASRLTSSVHSLGENKESIDSRWTLPKIEFIFSILNFAATLPWMNVFKKIFKGSPD